MAYQSQRTALILIYACLAMLVLIGLAQLPQTPGLPQILRLSEISGLLPQITRLFPNLGVGGLLGANEQRLSSLVDIPGCLTQVFRSLVNGQFSIIGNRQVSGITASRVALPGILPGNQDIHECWSSLLRVPVCLIDVMNTLFIGRVNFFGPSYRKAITLVSDHCSPKLFHFNLAFNLTLKNVCLIGFGVGGPTPSPLGADQITVSKLYLPVKLLFLGLLDGN
nr:uncharacterized protein LOC112037603 [Quercus suber]